MRKWLKSYRDFYGFTQKDVARKCYISRSFYTKIENGTKNPSVPVAKRIAEVLGFEWTLF